MRIEKGQFVRDTLTGATGTAVARTEWLNGCVRITIQPKKLKDSAPVDTFTEDESQLEVVNDTPQGEAKPTGGPREAATRAPDPTRF